MRRTRLVAIAAVFAVVLGLAGVQMTASGIPSTARAALQLPAIDVMQMMSEARELPEQSFEAI